GASKRKSVLAVRPRSRPRRSARQSRSSGRSAYARSGSERTRTDGIGEGPQRRRAPGTAPARPGARRRAPGPEAARDPVAILERVRAVVPAPGAAARVVASRAATGRVEDEGKPAVTRGNATRPLLTGFRPIPARRARHLLVAGAASFASPCRRSGPPKGEVEVGKDHPVPPFRLAEEPPVVGREVLAPLLLADQVDGAIEDVEVVRKTDLRVIPGCLRRDQELPVRGLEQEELACRESQQTVDDLVLPVEPAVDVLPQRQLRSVDLGPGPVRFVLQSDVMVPALPPGPL